MGDKCRWVCWKCKSEGSTFLYYIDMWSLEIYPTKGMHSGSGICENSDKELYDWRQLSDFITFITLNLLV